MQQTVFVGGGNMATALVGGLVAAGADPATILVVDPAEAQRARLEAQHGVRTAAVVDAAVAGAGLVVWAVKPQAFAAAAAPARSHVAGAVQLSVMAGIRSEALVAATGSERVVRAMPNTPALIGRGIAGLYARPAVGDADRRIAADVLAGTGELVWVEAEEQLDAVTALSGSGPAYVFHLIESMLEAARSMGLPDADARRLAIQTVVGSAELAARPSEPPSVLRRNVTSPGGTTAAALEVLEARGAGQALVDAILAARDRARALGG